MVQQVKDLELSMRHLGSLVQSLAQELPHAMGIAKKKERAERECNSSIKRF